MCALIPAVVVIRCGVDDEVPALFLAVLPSPWPFGLFLRSVVPLARQRDEALEVNSVG